MRVFFDALILELLWHWIAVVAAWTFVLMSVRSAELSASIAMSVADVIEPSVQSSFSEELAAIAAAGRALGGDDSRSCHVATLQAVPSRGKDMDRPPSIGGTACVDEHFRDDGVWTGMKRSRPNR